MESCPLQRGSKGGQIWFFGFSVRKDRQENKKTNSDPNLRKGLAELDPEFLRYTTSIR
jgi:hypothetical protein